MCDILIVSPDKQLANFIKGSIEQDGFSVCNETKGSAAITKAVDKQAKLIIIDEDITDVSPVSLSSQLKKEVDNIPIIVLLDEVSPEDFMRKYKSGANDFTTKPISTEKLLTRIKMHLTSESQNSGVIRVKNLKVDTDKKIVKRSGKEIDLTPTEYKLLNFLIQNKGRVLSREVILSRVWSYDTDVETRVVDVNIGYLRKKIDKGYNKNLIKTVRGFGYMLQE